MVRKARCVSKKIDFQVAVLYICRIINTIYVILNIFSLKESDRLCIVVELRMYTIIQIWVLRVKDFILQFLVDILPLGFGSVDRRIRIQEAQILRIYRIWILNNVKYKKKITKFDFRFLMSKCQKKKFGAEIGHYL